MSYSGKQVSLLAYAAKLNNLDYTIGLAKGKDLFGMYHPSQIVEGDWDGISIILDGIACVDFDMLDMDLGWHFLPPTWKERSPRGWHLFYRVPSGEGMSKMSPKIKWRPDVDLLIKGEVGPKAPRAYGGKSNHKTGKPFFGHVVISPTDGYKHIWPDSGVPEKYKLTDAPDWLCEALRK
jgi:hypothetical protein